MVQKVLTQWPSEGGNYHTDWICAIVHAPSVLYLIINAISCNFADDIKIVNKDEVASFGAFTASDSGPACDHRRSKWNRGR